MRPILFVITNGLKCTSKSKKYEQFISLSKNNSEYEMQQWLEAQSSDQLFKFIIMVKLRKLSQKRLTMRSSVMAMEWSCKTFSSNVRKKLHYFL